MADVVLQVVIAESQVARAKAAIKERFNFPETATPAELKTFIEAVLAQKLFSWLHDAEIRIAKRNAAGAVVDDWLRPDDPVIPVSWPES